MLIRMGATIMNGAHIGAGSVVGAGSLVTEHKRFPERSLIIGAPAKLVRPLDEQGVAKNRCSAAHYAAASRRFARELRRID